MVQKVLMFIIITLCIAYLGYRIFRSVRKGDACEKCELKEAAKQVQKKNNSV